MAAQMRDQISHLLSKIFPNWLEVRAVSGQPSGRAENRAIASYPLYLTTYPDIYMITIQKGYIGYMGATYARGLYLVELVRSGK